MSNPQLSFDQLLVEAIDDVLGALGEPVKNYVYSHLENDFSISKSELPQNIEEFSYFLFRVFGSSAHHLEIKFMKALYTKISANQHFKHNSIILKEVDVTFSSYVNALRESFEILTQ